MMRVNERRGRGFGQWRSDDYYDQYSATAERLDEDRPPLFPTDTTPMDLVVSEPNPGEAILRKEGEILPLTPVGARSVLVYPEVVPAPDITQDMAYEDRYPRRQHRMILRGSQGVDPWGPFPPPEDIISEGYYHHPWLKIGQTLGPLGQYSDDNVPIMFPHRPSDVAYQTYPGPFLGQEGDKKAGLFCCLLPQLLTAGAGIGLSVAVLSMMKPGILRDVLAMAGAVTAGIGVAGTVQVIVR